MRAEEQEPVEVCLARKGRPPPHRLIGGPTGFDCRNSAFSPPLWPHPYVFAPPYDHRGVSLGGRWPLRREERKWHVD